MTAPPVEPRPPRRLTPPARRVWRNVYRDAVARGIWRPEYIFALELIAQAVASYLLAREAPRRRAPGAEVAPVVYEAIEELHQVARAQWVERQIIPPRRERLAPVEAAQREGDLLLIGEPGEPRPEDSCVCI